MSSGLALLGENERALNEIEDRLLKLEEDFLDLQNHAVETMSIVDNVKLKSTDLQLPSSKKRGRKKASIIITDTESTSNRLNPMDQELLRKAIAACDHLENRLDSLFKHSHKETAKIRATLQPLQANNAMLFRHVMNDIRKLREHVEKDTFVIPEMNTQNNMIPHPFIPS